MRTLLPTSSFLLGTALFTLAQAKSHLNAHSVRHSGESVSVEESVESVEVEYGGGNGHTHEGNYHNGGNNKGEGKDKHGGNDQYDGSGEWKASILPTQTKIYTPVTTVEVMENPHVVEQSAVQTYYITTTVVESAMAVTITYSLEPQIVTKMVTVTEAGTCAPTGLASSAVLAAQPPQASTSTPPVGTSISAVSGYAQAVTSAIAASSTALAPVSPGSSGQVAQGTGTWNTAGYCDCACLCDADSFPTMSYVSAVDPPAASPTTLQTVASSPPPGTGIPTGVPANAAGSGTGSGLTFTSTTSTSVDAEPSSSLSATPASTTSTTASTSTSSSDLSNISATSSDPASTPTTSQTLVSAQTASATGSPSPDADGSQSTVPAQGPDVPFNISTLSLTSMLVLGNLGAQAAPTS